MATEITHKDSTTKHIFIKENLDIQDYVEKKRIACIKHFCILYFSAPKTFLLFSQKNVISRLVIDNDDLDPDIPEVVLPIPQLRNIKGLAYDPVDNYIYWIEGKHNVIKRSTDNGTHVSMSTGYTQ